LLSYCKSKPAGVWHHSWLVLYVMYFTEIGSNNSTFSTCWAVWCPMTCVIVQCQAAEWHQLCYWLFHPGGEFPHFTPAVCLEYALCLRWQNFLGVKSLFSSLPTKRVRIPVRELLFSEQDHFSILFFGGGTRTWTPKFTCLVEFIAFCVGETSFRFS
jgi:hypothetical protein